jgi:hypothetical protein
VAHTYGVCLHFPLNESTTIRQLAGTVMVEAAGWPRYHKQLLQACRRQSSKCKHTQDSVLHPRSHLEMLLVPRCQLSIAVARLVGWHHAWLCTCTLKLASDDKVMCTTSALVLDALH